MSIEQKFFLRWQANGAKKSISEPADVHLCGSEMANIKNTNNYLRCVHRALEQKHFPMLLLLLFSSNIPRDFEMRHR